MQLSLLACFSPTEEHISTTFRKFSNWQQFVHKKEFEIENDIIKHAEEQSWSWTMTAMIDYQEIRSGIGQRNLEGSIQRCVPCICDWTINVLVACHYQPASQNFLWMKTKWSSELKLMCSINSNGQTLKKAGKHHPWYGYSFHAGC